MNEIAYFLDVFPSGVSRLIKSNPPYILEMIKEMRLRKGRELVIYVESNALFLNNNGKLTSNPTENAYILSPQDFEYIVDKLCNNSFHTNIDSMINGYITAPNGSRVGICSSAVYKQGELASVKDITSLNIRIAGEYKNCSRDILNEIYINELPSIIVASLPAKGKTTFLRDFTRLITSGYKGAYHKATIIDERCEIAGAFDVGINTDILSGYSKDKGIELALRTLSPEIIVCDEIATVTELEKIRFGFSSGVKFAVSIHLNSANNIAQESIAGRLIETNEFDFLIILRNYTRDYMIYDLRNEKNETDRNYNDDFIFDLFGNYDN